MNAIPIDIKLRRQSRLLELHYADGTHYELPFEFLRVHSPSAEVRGHGNTPGVLPLGKGGVGIEDIELVGNYGIKPIFDDGHDSGIYTWQYLLELGENQARLWQEYQTQVAARGVIPLRILKE